MHPNALPELRGHVTIGDEPDVVIEIQSVHIPDNRDPTDVQSPRECGYVLDEGRGHTPTHPIGVREEVEDFKIAVFRDGCSETYDQIRLDGCNPDAGAQLRRDRKHKSFWMLDKNKSVGLI